MMDGFALGGRERSIANIFMIRGNIVVT